MMENMLAMLSNTDLIGISGGIILILGAARSERKVVNHPRESIKERLFAIGGLIMLIYSVFYCFEGGSPLFILLEIFICIASRLKMMKEQGKNDMRTLGFLGLSLITISRLVSKSEQIIRFILGFINISSGYVLRAGTIGRNAGLAIGGAFITIFSFLETSRIFFGVNLFFTFFAIHYRKKAYLKKAMREEKIFLGK